jgi:hypothetical protein
VPQLGARRVWRRHAARGLLCPELDGITPGERRGQFPIDAARREVDAAGLGEQSLEGIRLGTLTDLGTPTRMGATIA